LPMKFIAIDYQQIMHLIQRKEGEIHWNSTFKFQEMLSHTHTDISVMVLIRTIF
jgi:hypothetical protein